MEISKLFNKNKDRPTKDPVMPLPGIYPKDSKSTYHKDIFTSMFTVALFTNAKLWNQPRCPKRKEWIKENMA